MHNHKVKFQDYFSLVLSAILPLLLFAIFFQIWNVDFRQLVFNYDKIDLFMGNDSMLAAVTIKSIVHSGWYFSDDMIGLPHIDGKPFYFHDFPVHADLLNFVIIKIFTCFTSNPFLILNGFFIATLSFVSTSSFLVLKHFKISNFTALLISILFAFTPYHFVRNTLHLFLSNYMMIPPIVMVTLWIACDKIQAFHRNEKGRFYFKPNRFFIIAFIICCIASTTGIYYAFYSCIFFIFAWFLSSLENGKFINRSLFSALCLCATISIIVISLQTPSIIYWLQNGFNSQVANRNVSQSYTYGLKIISLFLPIKVHYFDYFSNIKIAFDTIAEGIETPAESLGIFASAGLIFLLIWPFSKSSSDHKSSLLQKTIKKFSLTKDDQNLISRISFLSLLTILFGTIGGLAMFTALPFPMFRAHARLSIFIAFLALFLVAIIFDKIINNKKLKPILSKFFVLIIFTIAIFDQVGNVSSDSIQNAEMRKYSNSAKNFVESIEARMPAKSIIFQLPISTFPEGDDYSLSLGYLYSKNLRWSYPAIKGRESANWQEMVSNLNFADFISELKKEGFSGVYIDRQYFVNYFYTKHLPDDLKKLIDLETNLRLIAKSPPIVSDDKNLIFFEI